MEQKIDTFKKWLKWAIDKKFKCEYCDQNILENEYIYESAEVEHFIPKSRGGTEVRLSCHFCNKLKRDEIFESIEDARSKLKKKREEYLKKFRYEELRKKYYKPNEGKK
ncbi:MAG: HNH endonuclease [Candidatus Pacearchaeota archaeon]